MPIPQLPLSPQKYIHYEFIDESATIMSPTLTQERSPSPSTRYAESESPLAMLIEAANANPTSLSQTLTPPTTPSAVEFKTADNIRKHFAHATLTFSEDQFARITGFHIELRLTTEGTEKDQYYSLYSYGFLMCIGVLEWFMILFCTLCISCIPIFYYLIAISLPYPRFTPCITHSELLKPPPWNLVVHHKTQNKEKKTS